jgi:rubrerythrin
MWAVVLYNSRHKHIEKFHRLKGDPNKGIFGAEDYMERMQKLFEHRTDIVIELISLTKAFPPDENQKKRKGLWWCPYCGKYRKFKHNSNLNLKICPICGIGERDFYVRSYNNLWHKGK